MKYFVILGLLAFVLLLVYFRLRPYLRVARQLFGVMRDAQKVSAGLGQRGSGGQPPRAPAEPLARCAACGTWLPASRALSLRSGATYCSTTCLERAAAPAAKRHTPAS